MENTKQQTGAVLDALCRIRGVSSERLGRKVNEIDPNIAPIKRQAIDQRRRGVTPITLPEAYAFAAVLDVPPTLFFDDSDSAIRWVLDNDPSGLRFRATGCFTGMVAA